MTQLIVIMVALWVTAVCVWGLHVGALSLLSCFDRLCKRRHWSRAGEVAWELEEVFQQSYPMTALLTWPAVMPVVVIAHGVRRLA